MSAATDYDPAQDSTLATDPGYVSLAMNSDFRDGKWSCPCGCLQVSKTKQFVMGHDARLRGILTRAHLAGCDVHYDLRVESKDDYEIAQTGYTAAAATVAGWHGWEDALLTAQKRKARAIEDLMDWAQKNRADVRKEGTAVIAVGENLIKVVTTLGVAKTLKQVWPQPWPQPQEETT